ncbi:hypothetical protein A2210_00725 [Candidatus Woesebacteria bacterium RIFOXYA1_FULL_40_18]|uniref:ComEC/Rec2-related protein domain-containing protein n=1 Tax=Candidatus Woesebacteria bacterium RIFOXYA1_FULL_40_18 TaxID=1802532 RepID=A0A1F8CLI0_9BACT|nr:MAG: hypothetical protein A2210_00725 [Candidatus Woesebacteria bacterium RIFOXYA1_FULL_40_18]
MRYALWIGLVLLVFARFITSQPTYIDGQKIRITTRISTEPTMSTFYQNLNLAGLKISLPRYPEIHYGDEVVVEAVVADKNLKDPVLISISETKSIFPKIRNLFLSFYGRNFPQPDASLIAGIVLGAKTSLPKDFWGSLTKTGTAHIVVASGMNVTFVAGFLMSVLVLFLKRKIAIPVALAGIWFYSALSGFDAPIVRAAIMGSVAFSAQELGRLLNAYKALFLTGLIMLIIVPQWLTDIGFILSFVATLSLMVFEKKIEKFAKFLPGFFKEGFATSLAAQIGVAPILFVTFGQFNILSPVINALVLWTIPPIMIIGALAGVIGVIFEPFGRLILYLAYPLTWWFIFIIRIFNF